MMRKHPLAQCEHCPLQGEKYVPSVGPEDAAVVFVGEAPGRQEVRAGEPFIGPSGQLLNAVLRYHQIDRRSVRLSNAVLCRPRHNADPPGEAIACCRPRLEAEIGGASRVVTLGRIATEVVLGRKVKIISERVGPPKGKVIPTLHPAYILRQPNSLPELVTDIGKIRYNGTRFQEPNYRVIDNVEEARNALRELYYRYNGRPLVVDVETGRDKDETFEHARRLLCLGIAYAPTAAIVLAESVLKHRRVKQQLSAVLQSGKLVAHNGKFDIQVLRAVGIEPGQLYFDTMLASYVLDERKGIHGLKYLAKERLGAPDWDAALKSYLGRSKKDFAKVPPEALHKYNAYDCGATYALYEILLQQLGPLRGLHDFLCRAAMALIPLEEAGLLVDQSYLEKLQDKYSGELALLEAELSPYVENPRSPLQVMAVFKELGISAPNTSEEILRKVAQRGGPKQRQFAELMLEHRKATKFYGTYIQGIWNRLEEGRVHPTYLLHGTTTGRLSCRNPNLQNQPRGSEIRSLFVPAPGNVFIQADYKAIELRVIATLAQDEYLRGVFNDDSRDIHREVAHRLVISRDHAKRVVYGLSYYMTPKGLAGQLGTSIAEATLYQREFFKVIPQTEAWQKSIIEQILHTTEPLTTPFGRRHRVHLITDQNKEDTIKEAMAFLPQSIASDITLSCIPVLQERGIDVRVPVHDSLLVEARMGERQEVSRILEEIMPKIARETFTDYVDFPVEVKQGYSWGEV